MVGAEAKVSGRQTAILATASRVLLPPRKPGAACRMFAAFPIECADLP